MALSLIDPPVTPFSSPKEIEDWLEELRGMKTDEENSSIDQAILDAQKMLVRAREYE